MNLSDLDLPEWVIEEASCAFNFGSIPRQCPGWSDRNMVWYWDHEIDGDRILLCAHPACLDTNMGPGEWIEAPAPTGWTFGPEGVEFHHGDSDEEW